jgi:hypothetical protein
LKSGPRESVLQDRTKNFGVRDVEIHKGSRQSAFRQLDRRSTRNTAAFAVDAGNDDVTGRKLAGPVGGFRFEETADLVENRATQ